ncbi:MAG: hypothetical protein ACFFG0_12065 [Candidatus Thorarchaeota archaeon]
MNCMIKTCPVCGNEFEVIEKFGEGNLYCTLGCLEKAKNESDMPKNCAHKSE